MSSEIENTENKLEYKFRGVLSVCNFEKLSFDNQLNILVENKIYTIQRRQKYIFKHQSINSEYNGYVTFITVPYKNLSEDFIEYRGFLYFINEEIICEIYNLINDNIIGDDFEYEYINKPQQKIKNHLSKLLNDNERFNFCVTKYNEYYSKIENIDEILYYENYDEEINLTWEQFIKGSIPNYPELIKKHLFCKYYCYDFDFVPFTKIWRSLIESTEMMNFIKNKMQEYQSEQSIKNIDLSFKLSLLEKIMKIDNWEDISATKKGKILTNLLGNNFDNIKNYYLELEKNPNNEKSKFYDKSGKYQSDKLKAEKIINELLG